MAPCGHATPSASSNDKDKEQSSPADRKNACSVHAFQMTGQFAAEQAKFNLKLRYLYLSYTASASYLSASHTLVICCDRFGYFDGKLDVLPQA